MRELIVLATLCLSLAACAGQTETAVGSAATPPSSEASATSSSPADSATQVAVNGPVLAGTLATSLDSALTAADRTAAQQAAQKAFALAPAGQPVAWRNSDAGTSGSFTAGRIFLRNDGLYCRKFDQTVTVGGETQQGQGMACRQADGTWRIGP